MIVINATFFVKPEMTAAFLEKTAALIVATRKETGCLAYELFQAVEDPNTYVMIENWQDQASVEQHNTSPLLVDLFKNIGEYTTKKSIISVSTATA